MEFVDFSAALSIPAFAVLIWQLQLLNERLKASDARYEKLVMYLLERDPEAQAQFAKPGA